jgi:signal peptidase I
VFRWVVSTVVGVVLVIVWGLFLRGDLRSFEVISGSMEPTLRVGDYVLTRPVKKGESLLGRVIAFDDPTHQGEVVTKRVVAVSGDQVKLTRGGIMVNSTFESMPESRLDAAGIRDLVVPDGHVFVLGDNRENSMDSLDYGPVPLDKVVGVVFLRYWPLSSFGRIR